MPTLASRKLLLVLTLLLLGATRAGRAGDDSPTRTRRLLYVAVPGIRNYLEYGGHGVLVFDIDNSHAFVRRIPTRGLDDEGRPRNVKGVCASADTRRLHIATTHTLQSLDLETDELLWERSYDGGCDRMAVSPDGAVLYTPSFEQDHWHVVDALTGDVLARLEPKSGAHNTVFSRDGRFCYLAGLKSPLLAIADARTHTLTGAVGPFSAPVRPFTVNGRGTRCYVNVNGLLGFEVGDLETGQVLHRVEVSGVSQGPVKRHGCPSHGVGLTPDETQVWVCDAHNQRGRIFDARQSPPAHLDSIALRDEPGWLTFTIDGQYAYPSSGEVIDVASRTTVAHLTDEEGRAVGSEKMVEVDMQGAVPVRCGDQFGLGRVVP